MNQLQASRSTMDDVRRAAELIGDADALLIGAGAGMGVDSGLPDFRGNEGFWKAYPPFQRSGLSFFDMADPVWFQRNPRQAWGFYGHRFNMYRHTRPHDGFGILKRLADNCKSGGFVFTSNVDGHFQKSGFDEDQTVECHGSINFLQCSDPCGDSIWTEAIELDVDESTFLAREPLPSCRHCGAVARPNILMFGDGCWLSHRSVEQVRRYEQWLGRLESNSQLVVIEMGAGTSVPTVRYECEHRTREKNGTLIRINTRESRTPPGDVSVENGALEALRQIVELLS